MSGFEIPPPTGEPGDAATDEELEAYATDADLDTEESARTTADALKVAKAGDTMSGELVVPDLSVAGITGAVAGTRFVGATASGTPASGTFAVGDVILSRADNTFYQCTVAGSQGTWVRLGGDRVIAHVESDATQSGVTTVTDITSLTLSNFVVTVAAFVILDCPYCFGSADGQNYGIQIADGSNVAKSIAPATSSGASHFEGLTVTERIATPGTYTRKGRIARIGGAGTCGVGAGTGLGYWQRLYVLGV